MVAAEAYADFVEVWTENVFPVRGRMHPVLHHFVDRLLPSGDVLACPVVPGTIARGTDVASGLDAIERTQSIGVLVTKEHSARHVLRMQLRGILQERIGLHRSQSHLRALCIGQCNNLITKLPRHDGRSRSRRYCDWLG